MMICLVATHAHYLIKGSNRRSPKSYHLSSTCNLRLGMGVLYSRVDVIKLRGSIER